MRCISIDVGYTLGVFMEDGRQKPSGRARIQPLNEAAPFALEEIFFSRTDARGIILAGNAVFQRISQFSWSELIGAPHNLIRHPDMPKAVFYLLWQTIKQGKPIGAYVKNMAKDGRYYWVFAVVTPLPDGGFLSVRIKPCATLLEEAVTPLYRALRQKEYDGSSTEDNAAELLSALSTHGFEDYTSFMAYALATEMRVREEMLQQPRNEALSMMLGMFEKAGTLAAKAAEIGRAYRASALVPLNMRVHAAQLKQLGATISVVAENYAVLSHEIHEHLSAFAHAAHTVRNELAQGVFLNGTAQLQQHVTQAFANEPLHDATDSLAESQLLMAQAEHYQAQAASSMKSILREASQFQARCLEVRRLSAALEVTRIMSKVESAHLPVAKDGLNDLMADLEQFQLTLQEGLKTIEYCTQHVLSAAEHLIRRSA